MAGSQRLWPTSNRAGLIILMRFGRGVQAENPLLAQQQFVAAKFYGRPAASLGPKESLGLEGGLPSWSLGRTFGRAHSRRADSESTSP